MQLYAQTGSSSENMMLMMRRMEFGRNRRVNEKEFIPLTGVSYVVMKVSRGYYAGADEVKNSVLKKHTERLSRLLRPYSKQVV